VVMSGHNHANIYDGSDANMNLHHFTTSAVMNYPTQARIVRISNQDISVSMSRSVSPDIDQLSLNLIQGAGVKDPRTFLGSEKDRTVLIPRRGDLFEDEK